jgi:hypothetical protein
MSKFDMRNTALRQRTGGRIGAALREGGGLDVTLQLPSKAANARFISAGDS